MDEKYEMIHESDSMNPYYEVPKGQAESFNLSRSIYISRIIIVPKDKDIYPKIHWEYTFRETNIHGITHTVCYYSKNLLALQEHRKHLIEHYNHKKEQLERGSDCMGIKIKPTLIQQIFAKEWQKIK